MIKTPYYLIDENLLIKNLEILGEVKRRTGCKILLAQKAFACPYFYPLISKYLDGTTASGLFESRLGRETFGREVHVFSPAYGEDEFTEILGYVDHIVFNSLSQLEKYGKTAKLRGMDIGLRINPECSTQSGGLYDPCAVGSRMGVLAHDLKNSEPFYVDGLHFHTLCEQNSDALETTLKAVEDKFSDFFSGLKWVNFGGGHHITRDDYDIERLVRLINDFKEKYKVEVYLEPGEAVVLNAGFLVAKVLDIVENGIKIAILDASAACHMPDVLEVPYTPKVVSAIDAGGFSCRLSSNTCLAGDIIGDYRFEEPLKTGDEIIFTDMALYTFVKNNTFNGIPLPSLVAKKIDGSVEVIKEFSYSDFAGRLGAVESCGQVQGKLRMESCCGQGQLKKQFKEKYKNEKLK